MQESLYLRVNLCTTFIQRLPQSSNGEVNALRKILIIACQALASRSRRDRDKLGSLVAREHCTGCC